MYDENYDVTRKKTGQLMLSYEVFRLGIYPFLISKFSFSILYKF